MSTNRFLLLSACVTLLFLATWAYATHRILAKPQPPPGHSYVSKVFDGDTIEAETGGERVKVRLLGVDTPETVDPRRPIQCFGKEASERSKAMMSEKIVRLVADQKRGATDGRDKYGRLLRYVYLTDGSLVNESLIRDGFAHEYTYQNQPYDFQANFKAAEHEARSAERGLWSGATCHGDTKQAAT